MLWTNFQTLSSFERKSSIEDRSWAIPSSLRASISSSSQLGLQGRPHSLENSTEQQRCGQYQKSSSTTPTPVIFFPLKRLRTKQRKLLVQCQVFKSQGFQFQMTPYYKCPLLGSQRHRKDPSLQDIVHFKYDFALSSHSLPPVSWRCQCFSINVRNGLSHLKVTQQSLARPAASVCISVFVVSVDTL